MTRSSRAQIDAFLQKAATLPVSKPAGKRGRLMFAMDATASREWTWDHACHIQGQMFQETTALGGLDIQLCYYRGFMEFHASPWYSRSEDLLSTMTAVSCLAGHTQIGAVLKHALAECRQSKIDALVFVGDCIEEDVDKLGQLAGKLSMYGVPMFVFHEGGDLKAARAFQQLAHITQGAYCAFDAGSAAQLRELLSAVAVYAAGGRKALEDFSKNKSPQLLQLIHQVKKG